MVLLPIVDNYQNFSKAEKKIADYITAHPEEFFEKNANEFALATNTSAATVVRFARKIGFENYVDAKVKLVKLMNYTGKEVLPFPGKTLFIDKNDTYEDCAQKLLAQINDVCVSSIKIMNFSLFSRVIDSIIQAKNIYLAGIGASSIVAMDLYLKLIRLNKKVHYCQDSHVNLLNVMSASKKDVLISFSYSGSSQIVIETLKQAKEKDVICITITGSSASTLAQLADISLLSPAIEQKQRIGAVSSHYAQQCISDLIFLGLVSQFYDKADELIEKTTKVLDKVK